MKRWIYLLLVSLVLVSLVLTSCQSQDNPAQGKKSIMVTYSILGAVVRDLVGDKANVTVSIPNGLDPHEWEPSAKDIEALNKADLVIQNGLGLEGGMLKALQEAQSKGVKFFTASDCIKIRHVGEGEGIPSGDPDQAIGAEDPHLWTDPIDLKSIVSALSPVLKNNLNLDVSSQASDLENRLESLNKQITDKVAVIPQENRKLVTGHESMGYFAQRYGFRLVGAIIPSITTQAGVSAGDLAELKTLIEENQVRAIFTELGTSPVVAKAIGDETGVKVIELTTHQIPGDGSYFTFLTDMADTIIDGLK
jgi:zinc/manganese transport system substrate-binding protein